MATTKALVLQKVVKRYSGFNLQVDSLEVPRGSIMGLVGPNGAGKSTLIKIIMNLVHPECGKILVLGRDHVKQEKEVKNLVGYVPEECRIYEEVTPEWVGQFVSHYYNSWDYKFYKLLLEKFNLPGNKKVKKLSKGNKMKLSLALALAHRPELLLLDEPTSGLDPVARYDLIQELLEVIQDEARSVLLSSHIVGDIEKVADYVGFLRQGSLILYRDKESVLDSFKRVQFRLADTGARDKVNALFLHLKGEGSHFEGITGEYCQEMNKQLQNLGADILQVLSLTLEEVMIVLSREAA